MISSYHEYIFADFMRFYAPTNANVVGWEPIDKYSIVVYCDDGIKIFYDHVSRVVYSVHKRSGDKEFVDGDTYAQRFRWKLNAALNNSGLSREEIVDRTGISKAALSGYLTGRKLPGTYNLYKLARVLKCPPDELLSVGEWDL